MSVIDPKILTPSNCPLGLLGLKSFPGFVIFDGRIETITCLVFYFAIKMGNSLQNPYQKWKTAVTIFKKHQNLPTGTHKKRQMLFIDF